jgi:hypothetical protein
MTISLRVNEKPAAGRIPQSDHQLNTLLNPLGLLTAAFIKTSRPVRGLR